MPRSWVGPGYDTSRKCSFSKRRSEVTWKGNNRVKKQNTVSWLHHNTRLWSTTWFTLSLYSRCHQFSTKANLTVKHRTVLVGQEIPTTITKTSSSNTELYQDLFQTSTHTRTHTNTHTHTREKTKTQRQVLKVELFKKSLFFFFFILLHELTNFWHSYIFKHLVLIFVQKKVNNTKTYVTMISLFAYIVY